MGTFFLQAEHLGCQPVSIQNPVRVVLKLLADLVILAENAGKIAAGEEDGAGAFDPGDGGLFAEMKVRMAYPHLRRHSAETKPTAKPVHATAARAAFTLLQEIRQAVIHGQFLITSLSSAGPADTGLYCQDIWCHDTPLHTFFCGSLQTGGAVEAGKYAGLQQVSDLGDEDWTGELPWWS